MVIRVVLTADAASSAEACLRAELPRGDPTRVRQAARRSFALADELDRAMRLLQHSGDAAPWKGHAHDAFADAMQRSLPKLGATAQRYREYGAALSGYAVALDDAVGALPWLAREIGRRREELAAASPTSVLAGTVALRSKVQGQHAYETASEDLWPWLYRFADAHVGWAEAVDRCVRALLQANSHDPTRDLHGWSALTHNLSGVAKWIAPLEYLALHPSWDRLAEVCDILSTELASLALALTFVFPPAAAACFTAATVVSAFKLGVDSVRAKRGEHVSNFEWGMDALGIAPVGAMGKVAKEVASLGKVGDESAKAAEATHDAVSASMHDLPDGLRDSKGVAGPSFVLMGPMTQTRRLVWRSRSDSRWGLTRKHLNKHLFSEGKWSLRTIDPGGNPDIWFGYLQELASRPATEIHSNGVEDVVVLFPKTHGVETFQLGIRFWPSGQSYEFVTLLTGQFK